MTVKAVLHENQQLALDTILGKPTRGIPVWSGSGIMEHRMRDYFSGRPEGSYVQDPIGTSLALARNCSSCMIDQYIPTNALSITAQGYNSDTERGATTGAEAIVRDGMVIDSPETAVEHMERFVIPGIRNEIATFDAAAWVKKIIEEKERPVQEAIAPTILKAPYGWVAFPTFRYGQYGYENYFMAYALYPDVIERVFSAQADFAEIRNRASIAAYREGNLPPYHRLDHDMADSRGTLVSMESLDRMWLPHFARSIKPLVDAGIKLIWHCDGNLMGMVPRLLEAGVVGFQGFQYEDGMDYEQICRMKTRDGADLLIIAGVSVTRTLPFGTPSEVARHMKWLVDNGPRTGLFLGPSSSVAPGVPQENLQAMIEGFRYYRQQGRTG